MKVGLVRHFRVQQELNWWGWLTPEELRQWFARYDAAAIEPGRVHLQDVAWRRCYSSDLPRAVQTATAIYAGPIECTPLLREVALPELFAAPVRLPLIAWALLSPLAWHLRPGIGPENRAQVEQRVTAMLDEALGPGEDVLLVGHGALMGFLRRELLRRGFRGPRIGQRPPNGALFVFENGRA